MIRRRFETFWQASTKIVAIGRGTGNNFDQLIEDRAMVSPLRQTTRGYREKAEIEDRVLIALSSFTRDGETAFRARGRGFQGLAVVAHSEAQAKDEAREVLAALRRARGQTKPYHVEFV